MPRPPLSPRPPIGLPAVIPRGSGDDYSRGSSRPRSARSWGGSRRFGGEAARGFAEGEAGERVLGEGSKQGSGFAKRRVVGQGCPAPAAGPFGLVWRVLPGSPEERIGELTRQ